MENRLAELVDQTRQHLEKLAAFGFDVVPMKQSDQNVIPAKAGIQLLDPRFRGDDKESEEFAKLQTEVLACTRC